MEVTQYLSNCLWVKQTPLPPALPPQLHVCIASFLHRYPGYDVILFFSVRTEEHRAVLYVVIGGRLITVRIRCCTCGAGASYKIGPVSLI